MDLGFVAGIAGVVLTMAAFCAAATAFPAAVVVSLVSVLLAGFAWWSGSWRTAWTTIYFCLAAVLASPALLRINLSFKWIAVLGAIGLFVGAALWMNYFAVLRAHKPVH